MAKPAAGRHAGSDVLRFRRPAVQTVQTSHARVCFGRYVLPCLALVADLGLLALGATSLQSALQDAGPSNMRVLLSVAAVAAALSNLSGMACFTTWETGPLGAATGRREQASFLPAMCACAMHASVHGGSNWHLIIAFMRGKRSCILHCLPSGLRWQLVHHGDMPHQRQLDDRDAAPWLCLRKKLAPFCELRHVHGLPGWPQPLAFSGAAAGHFAHSNVSASSALVDDAHPCTAQYAQPLHPCVYV